MPKPQVVQLPLPVFQALLNKVAERPYSEVAQIMSVAQTQAKIIDAPEPKTEEAKVASGEGSAE